MKSNRHAVVIGASMAGLLAARVLDQHKALYEDEFISLHGEHFSCQGDRKNMFH